MNNYDITALLIFFIVIIALSVPLGRYMKSVYSDEKIFLTPVIRPLENFIYRICGIDKASEMSWKEYALGFIYFNLAGIVLLY